MKKSGKKVFLTGATGLIGTEVVKALLDLNFEVYALTIDEVNPDVGVHWIKGNLFDTDEVGKILKELRPEYLLNFAWCANGDYLASEANDRFRDASMALVRNFHECGGVRMVGVGTCFEYEFKDEALKESDALNPTTRYAKCKNELNQWAKKYALENHLSYGWGRIFYVFGKNEHPNRLTAVLVNSLKNGKKVTINTSSLIKDYMYTRDIAGAFAAFLASGVEGEVNICSGRPIALKDYAGEFARALAREDLLDLREEPTNQPPRIVGDNTRLVREVGYLPRWSLKSAVAEILA